MVLPCAPPALSASWNARAARAFPATSNGEYGIPTAKVPVLSRGVGARVWDTEGREYLDLTMAWGSALLGHAHPALLAAASSQMQAGTNFAAITDRAVELAERIQQLSPCAEQIRFVASGTEATLLCLRVAEAATGRRAVLKFEGAYHGQHPVGVASLLGNRTPEFPRSDPSGTGAPWVADDVLVAPFNDLSVTERILRNHAPRLAAVIVEPLHRCLTPAPGFLHGLRALTRTLDVPLVFDEVVTGFRLAPGGAQAYYHVQPDLVAYGKALGGGFPIGAFAGRRDLMRHVGEDLISTPNYAWSASTTGGNPVSCAAALATLQQLDSPDIYLSLHARGAALRQGLAQTLRQAGVPAQILGDGPLAQVAFSDKPVTTQREWLQSDRAFGRALMLQLLDQGVFLNPMGTKLYLSTAHTDADLDLFLSRFRAALDLTLRHHR